MPAWPDLQRALGAAVRAGPGTPLASGLANALVDPARFEVHRNHYVITLVEALETTFPVVRRVVGEHFFGQAARAFVRAEPPVRPCLFEYGSGLGSFLSTYGPAAELVYLADLARLEWAVNEAWHAADASVFQPDELAGLDAGALEALALDLHPRYRLVVSPWPVDRIWRAHRATDAEPEAVALDAGPARVLVRRAQDEIELAALGEAEAALLLALTRAARLGEALEAAAARPETDPGAGFLRLVALGALVRRGALAHLHTHHPPSPHPSSDREFQP